MNKNFIKTVLVVACIAITSTPILSKKTPIDFSTWKEQCDALPLLDATNAHTPLTAKTILKQLKNFRATIQQEQTEAHWLNKIKPSYNEPFNPFIQKIVVPTNSKIAFHGDMHGDIHSLNHFIATLIEKEYLNNNFEIVDPNFYIVFLGDYTDRGTNGAEVLSTIMRLKTTNPHTVFLVRGNHEEARINNRYGFFKEIQTKFEAHEFQHIYDSITSIYNLLPIALYVGTHDEQKNVTNYIQCCHGGIEARVNPLNLLQKNHHNIYAYIEKAVRCEPTAPSLQRLLTDNVNSIFTGDNGFMWSDFAINPLESTRNARGGLCGFRINQADTQDYLKNISNDKHKVRGFFRAHQHGDPLMDRLILSAPDKGVSKLWGDKMKNEGKLWNGIVCTFSVAPAAYKIRGYTKDYFGILTTASSFKDWRLEMITGYSPTPETTIFSGNAHPAEDNPKPTHWWQHIFSHKLGSA